jgi:uncharacterized membrane protein
MDDAVNDAVNDAVGERLARLEAEVAALRAEMAGLKVGVPAAAALPRVSAVAAAWPSPPVVVRAGVVGESAGAGMFAKASVPKSGASIESAIGAKVLSKVAVVMLLIGAALFLKWAFDNRWIGAGGRVAVGLVAGAVIVVWSERLRRQKMEAFSYALKAVGSGVLYLSLWAGFQLYHLVPGWVAFAAMVGVTAWNAWMAWSQDSQLLAGYALLGAYLTPVLLGTGGDHEVFLFSYLLVIAVGVLVLLRSKPWGMLLVGVLPVTAGFYLAWFGEYFAPEKAGKTAVFALLLWAVFAAIPLLAREEEGVITGVLTPVGAGMFGALAMYFVLAESGAKVWEPWAAVGFAAVYLALARVRGRTTAAAIHLSLGVVFLTVAIPLKATGRGILLGWMVEAVALLAVSTVESVEQRAKTVLRALGCVALVLGVVGAMVQPLWLEDQTNAFWNRGFGMEIGAAVALAAAIALSRRMREDGKTIGASAFVLLNVVLVVAMQREIALWFVKEQPKGLDWAQGTALADFAFSGWLMLQGAANLVVGFWKRVALARWIGLILLAVTVVKVFAFDLRGLSSGYRVVGYLALGVLLMAVSFAYQRDWLGLRELTATDDAEVGG